MAKTIVLVASGEGDFGAKLFEENYSPEDIYEEMVEEGVTEKVIKHEDKYNDEKIYVKFHEFGEVDERFIELMENDFIDYDFSKSKKFFVVANTN